MSEGIEDKIEFLERLGWEGACVVSTKTTGCDIIADLEESRTKLFSAVKINRPIQKNARDALKHVDIIIADGIDYKTNREASECWEVDILSAPERAGGRDFMHQRDSGIDQVIARFMAERGIALEINISEILNSDGILRSQIMGKIRQNIVIARRFKTPLILVSGASDKWGLRAPRDLMAVGRLLGMSHEEARSAVSEIPARILQKAMDRKNPNIIMKGLRVVKWGKSVPEEKRMYGWY